MEKNKFMFNPVRCTSQQLKDDSMTPTEGFLYFLTDTKQIYLAKNNEFIEMCGGINIVYGNKNIPYVNNGLDPEPDVTFLLQELEIPEPPLINDLILNKDGCFYRVKNVQGQYIDTTRLTLQGTGSGGGGGGGGGESGAWSVATEKDKYIYASQATEMMMDFTCYYDGIKDNYIRSIAFSIGGPVREGHKAFYTLDSLAYSFNETHLINLIKYMSLFNKNDNETEVYINVTDKYGRTLEDNFFIRIVNLSLTPSKNQNQNILLVKDNTLIFKGNIGGTKDDIANKRFSFAFYDDAHVKRFSATDDSMGNRFIGEYTSYVDITDLSHGTYFMEVFLEAQIEGTNAWIPSSMLTYRIIKFNQQVGVDLLAYHISEEIEQFTNVDLSYLLASKELDKSYSLEIRANGEWISTEKITSNMVGTYPLFFEIQGTYNITLTILESGLSHSFILKVIEYQGNLPNINPQDKTLSLYMIPRGKSNNSIDRDKWTDYHGRYTATLEKLYYGENNGWCQDEQGNSYLQLNSGAEMKIPLFKPFEKDLTRQDPNDPSVGSGMTIELDFSIEGITDYDADLIKCVSMAQGLSTPVVGFSITGNKIKFYSANSSTTNKPLTTITFVEGKRIRLSFVVEPNDELDNSGYFPMCYTYLNGILSNATMYAKGDAFVDSVYSPAQFEVDAATASIKIYGIRFYKTALSDKQILDNYTASLPTLEERQNRQAQNEVYDDDNLISFDKVSSEKYDLQIPYMVITGGYKTDSKNDKWKILPKDQVGQPGLPTGKKDYRLIDVEVVYPKNDYFKDYEDYSYTNVFENGLGMDQNFNEKPINKTGCIMYAQGTSSMEYPVKNLRLRFRSEEDYFTVRPDIQPVEIICMKADYMESSGSHNTGAANLIDDLYEAIGLSSPGQEHFSTPDNTIVTCIKGHPCLIFYSPTGLPGSYEYIGKYNLNLDKATPKPFGFDHDDSFGWLPEGEEYWEIKYADEDEDYKDPFVGQANPDDGADYLPNQTETLKTVGENEKINAIHCFEFLDNAVAVCNFLNKKIGKNDKMPENFGYEIEKNLTEIKYKEGLYYLYDSVSGQYTEDKSGIFDNTKTYYARTYNYNDTWYLPFKNAEGDTVPGWALGFESRYPEDRLGYHDADMLYPLASWLNELHYLKTSGRKAEADTRFRNEYRRYLDQSFLVFYYVVTEALLMADNRVKNMMIATWGKQSRYKLPSGEIVKQQPADMTNVETYFDYIWYPIFYDMDTMLGLDNTGRDRFNYYDEDTNPDIYNGDEVLWNFVRDTLSDEIDAMYRLLEGGMLNINKEQDGSWSPRSLIPYFNNNQANMANEAFYNGDAVYKYLDPAREGYFDGLNGKEIKPGEGPYLYAAQGDRSLTRENFIINRIKFLRGKHNSATFRNADQVEFRWNYPSSAQGYRYVEVDKDTFVYEPNKYYYFYEESEQYILDTGATATTGRLYFEYKTDDKLSISARQENVPPSTDFEFTSLQPCFAGVLLGKNGNVYVEQFANEEKRIIEVDEGSSANNTEAYILGLSSLSDLGDLSNKYVQKFVMSGENKLKTLKLGNPNKNYHNPYWSSETSVSKIDLTGSKYLETFNLQNCSSFQAELDFSQCPNIRTILLTGSNTPGVKLPINGSVSELRLPSSVRSLSIESNTNLTNEKFSLGTYDYGSGNKIGDPGGHYINDFSKLNTICIINTPIDSYDIVTNALILENYCIQDFNWRITGTEKDNQYIPTSHTSPKDGVTYYIWEGTNEAGSYREASVTELQNPDIWRIAKEKLSLITKDGDNKDEIVSIPILDLLQTKTAKKGSATLQPANALSGTIEIAVPAKVNQFNLYKKYNGIYPNVKIVCNENIIGKDNLTPAYTIEFYGTETVTDSTEPYHTVLTDGSYTLQQLISADGPAGVALTMPVKSSTLDTQYNFTRVWQVVGGTQTYSMDTDFASISPKTNLKLRPIFSYGPRTYDVKFYDWNGENPLTVPYLYNQTLASNPDTIYFRYRPHSDDSIFPSKINDADYNAHKRWGFQGWISESDFHNNVRNPKIINLSTTAITYDGLKLYPYYKEEDCRTTPSNSEFFEFVNYPSITYNGGKIKLTNVLGVNVKSAYRDIKDGFEIVKQGLAGSITIPAKDPVTNKPVQIIGKIDCDSITKIYFERNDSLIGIGGQAPDVSGLGCYGLDQVRYYHFIKDGYASLKYLGPNSFFVNRSLEYIDNLPDTIELIDSESFFQDTALKLDRLPTNLKTLGIKAFQWCTNCTFSTIPLQVTRIPAQAFQACGSLAITNFGNNGTVAGNDNNITAIEANAFASSGTSVSEITLGSSVTELANTSFTEFGANVFTVNNYTKIITPENALSYFMRPDGKQPPTINHKSQ